MNLSLAAATADPTAGRAFLAGESVVIVSGAGVVLAGFETRAEAEGALLRFREFDPPGADGCRIAVARRHAAPVARGAYL